MNIKLQLQKVNLQRAVNYLDLIKICDENIRLSNKVEEYKEKKIVYEHQYAYLMADIVADAIEISKVELFNEEQC
jgi:hypothetical protein